MWKWFFSFYVIESSAIGRRASLRSQQRNEDLFFTNTSPTKLIEPSLFDKYEISVVDFFFFLFYLLKILFEQEVILIIVFNLILMVYVSKYFDFN
jgi:hypothetical protein